eukprot:7794807-Pyramimonas_sp.AAC.1
MFISFNLNRVSFKSVAEVIAGMGVVGSGLHCLQEVSSWPLDADDEFDLEGWLAQRAPGSPCAILVPSGIGERLR